MRRFWAALSTASRASGQLVLDERAHLGIGAGIAEKRLQAAEVLLHRLIGVDG